MPYILGMVATVCEKCGRRHLVTYTVEPKQAWRLVVQDRWRALCPSCFDGAAERAGVRYQFVNVRAMSETCLSQLSDTAEDGDSSRGKDCIRAYE